MASRSTSASIAAMRAQRRTVASFRGVAIASNAAMRAQRRTVASFRENFKLPARLWEQREVLRCVDLHCGGEPATVVFGGGGVADAPGATMFAKRAHVMERMDRWREVLLHEPRGYPCSNARARRRFSDAAACKQRNHHRWTTSSSRPWRAPTPASSSPSRRRSTRSCPATTRSASRRRSSGAGNG